MEKYPLQAPSLKYDFEMLQFLFGIFAYERIRKMVRLKCNIPDLLTETCWDKVSVKEIMFIFLNLFPLLHFCPVSHLVAEFSLLSLSITTSNTWKVR